MAVIYIYADGAGTVAGDEVDDVKKAPVQPKIEKKVQEVAAPVAVKVSTAKVVANKTFLTLLVGS